ncbi:hypothetical protein [Amaricoccus solimangrovi]|uniref:Uncharacterized protein n=1 Tax=Amaricoccus solimangrovi TaxID=2589815 RepID=A0A501WV47_9RHOB|nr:hypothetical protein [Amaricoccus solimangrovi]TPE49756.1 hypothetical protein FJM51_14025 [Amaricoccus solimangrovi]
MKNPWMSAWLSAANKAAGPMRGAWLAEVEKQRRAFLDQWMKAWMPGLPEKKTPPARRRTRRK